MTGYTLKDFENHARNLDNVGHQRRIWLWSSTVVVICTFTLILLWEWLDSILTKNIWWIVVSASFIISMNWWYWTMKVIKIMIQTQTMEYQLIQSILTDIAEIKRDIQALRKEQEKKNEF